MIARDAVPIGHIPPLKRIDLGASGPRKPAEQSFLDEPYAEATARWMRQHEAARIWRHIVEVARG